MSRPPAAKKKSPTFTPLAALIAESEAQNARRLAGEVIPTEEQARFFDDLVARSKLLETGREGKEFTLGFACHLARLESYVVDSWIRRGMFTSSKAAKGPGSRRAFTFAEVVMLLTASLLQEQGVTVSGLAAWWEAIRGLGDLEALPGRTVLIRGSDGEVIVTDADRAEEDGGDLVCIRVMLWRVVHRVRAEIEAAFRFPDEESAEGPDGGEGDGDQGAAVHLA